MWLWGAVQRCRWIRCVRRSESLSDRRRRCRFFDRNSLLADTRPDGIRIDGYITGRVVLCFEPMEPIVVE